MGLLAVEETVWSEMKWFVDVDSVCRARVEQNIY